MARKTVRFDPLDLASVGRAIRSLQRFRDKFLATCDEVIKEMLTAGLSNAQNYLQANVDYTGALNASMTKDFDTNTRIGTIGTDSPYAEYVEYGTGLWGSASPHPEAGTIGWNYDVNNHGPMGWLYYNPRDGWYHWSTGVNANVNYAAYAANPQNFIKHLSGWKSRPFMYETRLYLETQANTITSRVFSRTRF